MKSVILSIGVLFILSCSGKEGSGELVSEQDSIAAAQADSVMERQQLVETQTEAAAPDELPSYDDLVQQLEAERQHSESLQGVVVALSTVLFLLVAVGLASYVLRLAKIAKKKNMTLGRMMNDLQPQPRNNTAQSDYLRVTKRQEGTDVSVGEAGKGKAVTEPEMVARVAEPTPVESESIEEIADTPVDVTEMSVEDPTDAPVVVTEMSVEEPTDAPVEAVAKDAGTANRVVEADLFGVVEAPAPTESAVEPVKEKVYSGSSEQESLFRTIDSRIREERLYANINFQRQDVLDKFGISRATLNLLLNTYADGQSFPVYINKIRLEEACDILEKDDQKNISDIAVEVGLAPHNFYRLFQQHFGQTPVQYRLSRKS